MFEAKLNCTINLCDFHMGTPCIASIQVLKIAYKSHQMSTHLPFYMGSSSSSSP